MCTDEQYSHENYVKNILEKLIKIKRNFPTNRRQKSTYIYVEKNLECSRNYYGKLWNRKEYRKYLKN